MRLESLICFVILVTCGSPAAAQQALEVRLEAAEPLANVQIDGKDCIIHTQGLFVTDKHYHVTGRLETRPQRALLLRFDRDDPRHYEYIDITREAPAGGTGRLDHPGGFAYDGRQFWIPIALSQPRPPTAIVRVSHEPRLPLERATLRLAFHVDDHVGALAWEPSRGLLFGANWDTNVVYAWTPDGNLVERFRHEQLLPDVPDWHLAIQDWTAVGDGLVNEPGALMAGGIDKSARRDPDVSTAVLELLDLNAHKRLAHVRLPRVEGHDGPVTNEGLALHGDRLYLLPGDIGRDAKVFRFQYRLVHR